MNFNVTNDISGFWSLFVIVVSLVSIIGCGLFLLQQERANFTAGQTTGHVWDETLAEYNNPLPNWWRWLFYITVVFALVYLALFPGLGTFNGKLNWSMRNQYDQEMEAAKAKYDPLFNKFLAEDIMTVAADPQAKEIGQRLFLTYCAQCHGSDAKGGKGFPNLTDKDWLWGGTPDRIEQTILHGRDAVMPPKGTKPDMDAQQVKDVVAYVRSLSGLPTSNPDGIQRGKELFPQACAACHGPEAKGNPEAGYPNLTDNVWLYGSSEATMIEGVTKGHINRMPAWGDFLGDAKAHLLAAYVWGQGGGVKPEPKPAEASAAAPAAAEAAPAPTRIETQ
jgi:cytochrome c oxidase cbb3-type subunit III